MKEAAFKTESLTNLIQLTQHYDLDQIALSWWNKPSPPSAREAAMSDMQL